MSAPSTLELIASLSRRSTRAEVARALAARLGAEDLLLFLPDPQLGVLMPAPGFAQTLRGGPAWRSFLAGCSSRDDTSGIVDLPQGTMRPALAVGRADIVAVLLGGEPGNEPRPDERAVLEHALPLVAAMLQCEHVIDLAGAEASEARESANRANALSGALEAARAEQARLNADLSEEHRRKDEFLAMLAHELRNPLSPLLTSLEILRHRGVTADMRDRHIEVMGRQVSQLSRLVDDLLDVSRVSRGRIELKRRPLSLAEVIDNALEACQPLLKARRHTLSLSMPDESLSVNADDVRLTQVFVNLLTNAAKYTDPGGHLVLTTQRVQQEAVVRLEDNGIGIAAEVLPHVFDLFAQGPIALQRAQGGLGIGLTLVRRLLELHGGSVSAESRGLGHGSSFIVRLPLADAEPLADADADADAASAGHTHELSVPGLPANELPLRVLIVDDNQDGADALARMFGLMGHHAEVAYGGIKALQLAAHLDPDLVFLDIGLPEIDGYELARRLRRTVKRATRIVALTGYGTQEDRRRTSEAGFDEHVVKPVALPIVREIIDRTRQGARAEAALYRGS